MCVCVCVRGCVYVCKGSTVGNVLVFVGNVLVFDMYCVCMSMLREIECVLLL